MHQTRLIDAGLLVSLRLLFLYGTAGAIGTAVHFAVLFATLSIAQPVVASTLGAIAGCIVNYYLARHFVFASTQPCNRSFPRFVTVAMVGIIINAAIIQAFVNMLPIAVNQVLASTIVLLTGFVMNKWWTFNDR